MKLFYSRVSSATQSNERQKIKTKNFDYILEDTCSGSIPLYDRPKGKQIKELIEAGTIKLLEVHSIDRLGRNTIDVLNTWNELTEQGITIVCRNPNLRNFDTNGKADAVSEMIIAILSIMAKFERQQIRERQAEGIAIAKLKGKYHGRKINSTESTEKFLNKPKSILIRKLLDKGRTYHEIRKIVNCSPSTIKKVKTLSSSFS